MAEPLGTTSDEDRGLTEADYDWSSRHIIASRLIEGLVPKGGSVLDIGGAAGVAVDLLPHHDVTVADVVGGGVDVIASGTHLPFRDRSFDAAISLDVLEHVERNAKQAVVAQAMRVADVVVLAGPYDDADVREAETEQRESFGAMYGYEHPWLSEHFESGLPDLEGVVGQLKAEGFETAAFGSNPLGLWSELRLGTHIAQLFDIDRETWPLRRHLVDDFLDVADATPPSYRHFVVGARHQDVAALVKGLRPGSAPAVVAAALARARGDTTRILGVARANVHELRVHAANLQAGLDQLHKTIEGLVEERAGLQHDLAGLQHDLAGLREAVAQDPLTRRLVERRLRKR